MLKLKHKALLFQNFYKKYKKFIKPSELVKMLETSSFSIDDIQGVKLNPIDYSFSLSSITKINYFMTATKK